MTLHLSKKLKNTVKGPVVILGLIFILLLAFRLPLAVVPFFNIDEGIFACFANTILSGQVPYRDVVDTLAPLTSYVFSLVFLIFGRNNMFAVHMSLILLIYAICLTLYFIGKLLVGRKSGYLAALFFCVFSYNFYEVDMLAFETEWLLALFSSLGAYFMLKYYCSSEAANLSSRQARKINLLPSRELRHQANNRLLLPLSGLCFGLAFFSKQPALLLFLAALLFCLIFSYSGTRRVAPSIKAAGSVTAGFLPVMGVFLLYFYLNNAWGDFWYWFWGYFSIYYVPAISLRQKIATAFDFQDSYFKINYLLLVLFVGNAGLVARSTARKIGDVSVASGQKRPLFPKRLVADWYLIGWCLTAYFAVAMSGRNYGHYYIMVLPPLCVLGANTVFYIKDILHPLADGLPRLHKLSSMWSSVIKLSLPAVIIMSMADPVQLFCSRFRLWRDLFSRRGQQEYLVDEFRAISEYVKDNSREDEKILVWGFAPELYAICGRMSASKFIYSNYLTGFIPWTNIAYNVNTDYAIVPGAWDTFMEEMRKNMPVYIIDTSPSNYRYYGKYPPEKYPQFREFLKEHYTVEETIFVKKGGWEFRMFRKKK